MIGKELLFSANDLLSKPVFIFLISISRRRFCIAGVHYPNITESICM